MARVQVGIDEPARLSLAGLKDDWKRIFAFE